MICEITNKLADYIDWIWTGDRVRNHYGEYTLGEVVIVIILSVLLTLFGVWWIVPLRILIFKPMSAIKFNCGRKK